VCGVLSLASTLLLLALAVFLWPRVFAGTPDGTGRLASAACESPGAANGPTSCSVSVLLISPGRFRVEANDPAADRMTLVFHLPDASSQPPRVLAAWSWPGSEDLAVQALALGPGTAWRRIDGEEVTLRPARRRLFRLDAPAGAREIQVVVSRAARSSADPLRLDEVGLYASEVGLLRDTRPLLTSLPDRLFYRGVLARCCLLLAGLGLLCSVGVGEGLGRVLAPAFVFSLTLAAVILEFLVAYSPYWSVDLRVGALTSGVLQEPVGANLNYGIYLGSRLLQGQGLTFGPGWVPWERMPGYGFLNALGGLLAGFKSDLLTVGLTALKLHVLLFAAANAFFVVGASRVMRPPLALPLAALVAFLPNFLDKTQVDPLMVPIYLLTAGALGLFLARSRSGTPPLGYHLIVHLSFALWFVMRPDGAPGWAAVSLIIHWRAWRYLVLPLLLFLMIGLPWGLYKQRYTGEFSMTTSTVGDNAWVGLWQVPNKLGWKTEDASWFAWAEKVGLPGTSERASRAALREVARFAATYPVYVAHLFLHKGLAYVRGYDGWGFQEFPHVRFDLLPRAYTWGLFTLIALSLSLGHEARRTLLLAWPLFFNLPLFFLFYMDGGRHVAAVAVAQHVAALPLLGESGFYRAIAARPLRAGALIAVSVAAFFLAHWADTALLGHDSIRYWAPFLDPGRLTWNAPH
jgi:hypothetical protein